MSASSMHEGAALLTMGADESGFPLAAIYRTRHGLSLPAAGALHDTDPPSEIPPIDDSVEGESAVDLAGRATVSATPSSELQHGVLEVLRSIVPPTVDQVFIAQALRAFAGEQSEYLDDSDAWYRNAFTVDDFRTRPPVSSPATEIEAKFVADCLGLPNGSRILDVGCGYGRLTNHLAALGLNIVGLDLSEPMLTKAQQVAQARGQRVDYVVGDMRSMSYDGEFDGVVCTDSTFGYFDPSQNLISLRGMARAIRPGGRLVLDVLNRDRAIHDLPGRSWWEGDGCLIQEDSDFDHLSSTLRVKRLLVFSDGRQRETNIAIRLYSAHELVELCELVGLQLVHLSGSAHEQGAFFSQSSRRLVLTARKLAQ